MKLKYVGILCMTVCTAYGQAHGQSPEWEYRIEAGATAGTGTYAPLWFTSNRYGLGTTAPNSGYLRAGIGYHQTLNKGWQIDAALDLAGTVNHGADTRGMGFVVQQAYADLTWKALRLSIGSKERGAFPLERNTSLSSGAMVEGPNARPVPQVRIDIRDYLNVPGTGGYTGEHRDILLCACSKAEAYLVKSTVQEIDDSAFIMFTETSEVYGEGFAEDRTV